MYQWIGELSFHVRNMNAPPWSNPIDIVQQFLSSATQRYEEDRGIYLSLLDPEEGTWRVSQTD